MRSLLVLLLLCGTASAGGLDVELARAHFLTGQSYYDQERFEDALKEFEEAYRLSSRPGFQYNIGVCHERLGRPDLAIEAFKRYLTEDPFTPDRPIVEGRIHELESKRQAVVASATAQSPRLPVYRKAWFWGVMGAAVVVVVTGITLGIVLGTRESSLRTLPDVRPE